MQLFYHLPIYLLIVLTAAGHALATVGMKTAATGGSPTALVMVSLGLTGAVLAEIALLRHTNLAVAFVMIVAFEALLVLCFAASLGETLTAVQGLGAVLVLIGLAVILR
ncbi:5-aminolevulinate synthase [Pseudooceanicola pacificus]|uniref:5-aminolevulinate synthase n=1 Tax=Pseudooceanicola pacificus TaxID=2676438 RepID=UPI001923AF2A|nr:5-aminolevulinate synthase [Pseudooceanicola pacificus]